MRPVRRWMLWQTIINPGLKEPVLSCVEVNAVSVNAAVKSLKLSGKQQCELKNYGKTVWYDQRGGTHTIELKEETLQ